MKIINFLILLLCTLVSTAANDDLNRLMIERQQQSANYQLLVDSVIPNRWVKQVMLHTQLQLINSIDDSIINHTNTLVDENARMNDSMMANNTRLSAMKLDVERVQERARNDMNMLLMLKVAVALLLVLVLALVYFLIKKKPVTSDKNVHLGIKVEELEKERVNTMLEIKRLKSHEIEIKEELEKAMQLNQERFALLNETKVKLEEENRSLLEQVRNQEAAQNTQVSNSIQELTRERDQIAMKVISLQEQLASSKAKNEAILRKINKLITDLSGVSDQ